jgi:hypothetical protein
MTGQTISVTEHLEKLNAATARAKATFERAEAVLRREIETQPGPVTTAILHFVMVSAILLMCWMSYDITHNVLCLMRAP